MKLAARPGDLPGLRRALAAMASAGDQGRAKLISTYYDTPDLALGRRGLALRVRERDGQFQQTVKSAPHSGGVLARGEWQDTIAGPQPDPQAPDSGPFLAGDIASRLVPMFRTKVTRQAIDLFPAAGAHVEVAIDRGRICAGRGGAEEPISEIELELKSGAPSALYKVALELLDVAPVRLEWRSKAERGYRLIAGDGKVDLAAEAAHARPVELDRSSTGDDALRRIGFAGLDQVRRSEPAVLAGKREGIHQMRVAVRRLRAMLSALAKMLPEDQRRWASEELRWLADALGAARNLDVFKDSLLLPAQKKAEDAAAFRQLTETVERKRRAACRGAVKAIRSPRYTRLMLSLLRWFEECGWRGADGVGELQQNISEIAPQVLSRRWKAAKKRGKGFGRQSAGQRHRLRIALKKLRYAAEALGELYAGAEVTRYIDRLKRLQDDLGDANDVRVGHEIAAALAPSGGRNRAMAAAARRLLDWHDKRLTEREPQLRRHLRRLRAAEPFWQA